MGAYTSKSWRRNYSSAKLAQWGVGDDLYIGCIVDGDQVIAIVAHDGMARDEALSNFHLMAAAPDLLEALIELVESYGEHGHKEAIAAIAKATGEQP